MSDTERLLSPAVEDYLKAIYKLQQESAAASTNDIARKVKTSPAAATKMLKHLAEMNLVLHTPYYGATLTEAGMQVALEIIRHHRLLELYLHKALGYSWDEVDAEAEKLEHHISEEFEERINRMLGNPETDPHGDPIPTREGTIAPYRGTSLADAQPEQTLVILRVRDSNPEALRYLARIGMTLGVVVEVLSREPFNGDLKLSVDGVVQSVGQDLAGHVFVEPIAANHENPAPI